MSEPRAIEFYEEEAPDPRPACDLLRNQSGMLILIDQWKSGDFIRENPSFSIVGIGLSREATDTPYGKIGAVLE